ncbi:hypothetical protein FRC09_013926 [Ceratobasidium sp. 395]|nr:hypothetical protein FRC09_013926 [Ceratobasidium sp. 395]
MDAGSGVQHTPPVRESTPRPRKSAGGVWNEFVTEAYKTGEVYEKQYGIPARKRLATVGGAYPFTTVSENHSQSLLKHSPIYFDLPRGFSAFILISFVSTALVLALVFAGAIILGASAILLCVISMTFGFALFLTISGFMAFISYRLVFHVRSPEGQGLGAWKTETMMRFGLVDVGAVRDAFANSGSRPTINGKAA